MRGVDKLVTAVDALEAVFEQSEFPPNSPFAAIGKLFPTEPPVVHPGQPQKHSNSHQGHRAPRPGSRIAQQVDARHSPHKNDQAKQPDEPNAPLYPRRLPGVGFETVAVIVLYLFHKSIRLKAC